jgi:hypothetical protein
MNSFGGSAVVGTFMWMLFFMNFDGPWVWWLPFISMLFWLPRDGFTLRFGHKHDNGTISVDTQFTHHAVYTLVRLVTFPSFQHGFGAVADSGVAVDSTTDGATALAWLMANSHGHALGGS